MCLSIHSRLLWPLLISTVLLMEGRCCAEHHCMANMSAEMISASGHRFGALGSFSACQVLPHAKYCTLKEVLAPYICLRISAEPPTQTLNAQPRPEYRPKVVQSISELLSSSSRRDTLRMHMKRMDKMT